jgi:hypothetical protein
MRSQVKLVRENKENLDSKGLKKAQADTKKKLRLYANDEERPKKKRRKSGNKSRCSNLKITIFDEIKTGLDNDQILRKAWEVMYKQIMNRHVVEDSDNDDEEKSVSKIGQKWLSQELDDPGLWDEV